MGRMESLNELNLAIEDLNETLLDKGFAGYDITLKDGSKCERSIKLEIILTQFLTAFYGKSPKSILLSRGLKGNYNLEDFMPEDQINYFEAAVVSIKRTIAAADFCTYYDTEFVDYIGQQIGKMYKISYIDEKKEKPLDDFKKQNSDETLEKILLKTLEDVQKLSEEDIIALISYYQNDLKKAIPLKFENEKSYGTLIGKINYCFYGKVQSDIFKTLRDKNIKVPGDNVVDIMPDNQLVYRAVSLVYLNRYYKKIKKVDLDAFISKTEEINKILKKHYVSMYGNTPMQDLTLYVSSSEGKKRRERKKMQDK